MFSSVKERKYTPKDITKVNEIIYETCLEQFSGF